MKEVYIVLEFVSNYWLYKTVVDFLYIIWQSRWYRY